MRIIAREDKGLLRLQSDCLVSALKARFFIIQLIPRLPTYTTVDLCESSDSLSMATHYRTGQSRSSADALADEMSI